MVNVAAIFSTLGNPNSLIPLLIKDSASTAGMTTASMMTGKEEGHDRLIDEVGTEIIWLCAIPAFKWLFDKTIFKAYNFDSKFDVRNLKNTDIFQKAQELAPSEEIRKNLEKISKKQGLFKNLALYKFFFSTAMAIVSYIGLTKAKQAYTEKKIKKNLIDEYNAKKLKEEKEKNIGTNNPSFKGVGDVVKNFAFSPVRNMWILDGAITTERLADSRTPQEFAGYAIKESSILFFMYYAGGKIQKALENRALKKHNKTIALDARILESGHLQTTFKSGSIQKSLDEFKSIIDNMHQELNTISKEPYQKEEERIKAKYDTKIYEFLHKNPDNEIVKAAKEAKIIKMYKETNKIDTRKFIDIDEIKNIYKNIELLYTQYLEELKKSTVEEVKKGMASDRFFSQVKKLKRYSIITNMGTCMFALGVLTPAIMLAKRLAGKDDTEFETKKEIREQLLKEGIIK